MFLITPDEFVAGWISGFLGIMTGHPLETVKVRQQISQISVLKAISIIWKYEGPHGYFKGMTLPILSAGALNSIFFGVYGNVLRFLQNDVTDNELVDDPLWQQHVWQAGSIAGLAQVIFANPVEVVKVRLQTRTGVMKQWGVLYESPYKGVLECLIGTWKFQGIKGFYRGFIPMILRDVPTLGLYCWIYSYVEKWLTNYTDTVTWRRFIAGGLAGSLSYTPVMPFDVVKSRMQADNPVTPKYKGMIDCFIKSYHADGLRVFNKGLIIVCIRAFPVNGIIFVSYEKIMERCLERYPKKKCNIVHEEENISDK